MRRLHRPDRLGTVEVIRSALAALASLGLPDPWGAGPYIERADALEQAAERVARPAKAPPDTELADQLALGELGPAELARVLDDGARVADADRAQRILRSAADRARIAAEEAVRRVGDGLVTGTLRGAVDDALRAGDAVRWVALADVADELRSARLLPVRLSVVETGTQDRRNGMDLAVSDAFPPLDYRCAAPQALPANAAELSAGDLLAVARGAGAGPGIFSDDEVYRRAFPTKRAARTVVSGSR